MDSLAKDIFTGLEGQAFEARALEIFRMQAKMNPVYREFIQHLGRDAQSVRTLDDIPFLPIELFKSHKVLLEGLDSALIFSSSGTTGSSPSQHFVSDLRLYEQSFFTGFDHFFGEVQDYVILALLPSYLERKGSSLVYMADHLIKASGHKESGFYLDQLGELAEKLKALELRGQKTILLGVSYALLDLIELGPFSLKSTLVMETGGMKGRRKEMVKEELHRVLSAGFGVEEVCSEYGMTELLSQAYSLGKGRFSCPPWMRIMVRDPEDPFQIQAHGRTGGINVIDLANVNSCSFIATQDLGRSYPDHSFEILGRFDHSDIRGCNLMVL